ncbi:MAG: hypothetical protein JWQ35_1044 [Bacteriovoracaceae bacterium]|nr:hypothetical protein [Bacteriovoracaceae bacterium]
MSKFSDSITQLGNYFLVGAIIAATPWLLGSSYLWKFSSDSLVSPLTVDTFELPFKGLLNHRIILNMNLLQPTLVLFSFAGILLLLAMIRIFYFLIPKPYPLVVSLLAAALLYTYAAPGSNPLELLGYLIPLLLIVPLFRMPSSLLLWALGSFGVVASLINPGYQFPVLWLASSLALGHLIHFVVADQGIPKRKIRVQLLRYLPNLAALLIFGFWISFSILTMPPDWSLFHPSSFWQLGWIVSIECIVLALFEPWKTNRWLSIGIFSQGLLFFQELDRFIFFVFIGVSIEICVQAFIKANGVARIPAFVKSGFRSFLILTALTLMFWKVYHFESNRNFNEGWISMVKEMKDKDAKGFLIVGKGLPFLAHFIRQPLVQDDNAILKTSEKDLEQLMKSYAVTDIIVDKNYLNEFWRNWIASGKSVGVSNYSVISRAISYKGQAVDTPTLKFPELHKIISVPLDGMSEFVWLKTK